MNLVIIGLPYALAVDKDTESAYASELAPQVWQMAGLVERLAPYVSQAVWVNLPAEPAGETEEEQIIAIGRQLRDTVRTVRAAGAIPLILGGDPLLAALGSIAGLQAAGNHPALVWFDALSDIHVPVSPLALLSGLGELPLTDAIGLQRTIPEWRILVAGVRGTSPQETHQLEESAVTVWSTLDLHLAGAQDLGRDMRDWPPIYLHLNLNVLDPSVMPAVTRSVKDGMALETLIAGIEAIAAGGEIAAVSITGFAPGHQDARLALPVSMQVIEALVRTLAV